MNTLAIDPLFTGGQVDPTTLLIVIVKTVVVFAVLLVGVMFYVWFMRKVIAVMQNRVGPKRAGPFGALQTLADGIKLFFKEQSIPDSADESVFRLAPYLSIMPAFIAFSIVPIGGTVWMFGERTRLQLADPAIGVLLLLAMSGIGLYGVMLAGWSSGSKYPLLGSVRASAQLLSYEAILGLSIVGVLFMSNSLETSKIVADQKWTGIGSMLNWNVVPLFLFFVLFIIAAIGETNHPPFDLVEAEQELVGGFHTEYTGIRFAIFFLAEFMNVITMSAIAVTLFLGGPAGPKFPGVSASNVVNTWLMPIFWFTLKLLILLFCTVWVRASLPRLRYDQLMRLSWKVLIEVAFLAVLFTIVVLVGHDQRWNLWLVLPAALVGAVALFGILRLCMPRADEPRDDFESLHGAA
ncbi:MAG: NADH-quinone oxidoreductase subunit NuoH [Acidimicrobiia bacterium]